MTSRLKQLLPYLKSLGISPRKALSQNFLIDPNIVDKVVDAADVGPGDTVLEIGPGPGALTEVLLARGARVIAVEYDPALAQGLARLQTEDKRLEVHLEDILRFPLEEKLQGQKVKVVASLPYHISSPILTRLVPLTDHISTITVVVQKEVAVRYASKPNTSDYSSISVYLQFFSTTRYLFTIPNGCFYPAPKVESAAIAFTLKKPPIADWEPFVAFVRKGFNQRRKMLRSSLKSAYPEIRSALAAIGKPEGARPQELSVEDFLSLFRALAKESKAKE